MLTGFRVYSPSEVDRILGIWGSYYNLPLRGTIGLVKEF